MARGMPAMATMDGVRILDVERGEESLLSREDMPVVISEVLNELRQTEIPIEDFQKKEEVERDRSGKRVVGWRPEFELRYRGLKFPELGVAATIPRAMFRDRVIANIEAIRKQLSLEQPACDWQLVCALVWCGDRSLAVPVSQKTKRGQDRVDAYTGNSQSAEQMLAAAAANLDPAQVNKLGSFVAGYRSKRDLVWKVHMAWADVSQADLVDPNVVVRKQLPDPQLKQYIETRQLRYMPPGMRANRASAEKVIDHYLNAPVIEPEVPELPDPIEAMTDVQLRAALDARRQGIPFERIAVILCPDVQQDPTAVYRLESRVISYCREIGEPLMGASAPEPAPAPRPRGRPKKEEAPTPGVVEAARPRKGWRAKKADEEPPPRNDTEPREDGAIEEER